MKETEEIELQDVELFAEYLEFQMLPGLIHPIRRRMRNSLRVMRFPLNGNFPIKAHK